MSWPDRIVDRVDAAVTGHPGRVVIAFLVLTGVFATGFTNINTESGTDQFTSDLPSQEAFEAILTEFGHPFAPATGSTQLIQAEQNVLAKPSLLRMLRTQERIADRPGLRVTDTTSAAQIVAQQLEPNATTLDAQVTAIERATPTEIDAAVRRAADQPGFEGLLSNDFNRRAASASATIATVSHQWPGEESTGTPGSGSDVLTRIQLQERHIAAASPGNIRVFGSGIITDEFSNVILDSLIIVVPAAALLILVFLLISYRDPIDLLLGVIALVMAVIWTFGFTGLAGIAFSQLLVAIPPLLLAVGIDFGIHAINRYREERVRGVGVDESMRVTLKQLLVAFFIVAMTTVIGFWANLTSSLPPIREFGLIAGIGILFTLLIFGVFLPAAKLWADERRERYGVPSFAETPLGAEGSRLGRLLTTGVSISRIAPVGFLLLVLVATTGAGLYATGVSTSFQTEDFLPPEETPAYLDTLPEPFRPNEYTVTRNINFLEEHFGTGQQDSVTIYVQGPLHRDTALEAIERASRDPPDSFRSSRRAAEPQSVITVIQSYAAANPEFARLVERNDINDNNVPDDNLEVIYDRLLQSPYQDQARRYLADDRRSMRVIYTVDAEATQAEVTADARTVAERYRMDATATGQVVVFQAVSDRIFQSSITSLGLALGAAAVFLVVMYWGLEGRPWLGLVNLLPIVVTVAFLAASMRAFEIPLNALTATILAITIGLGVDYSVHVVHRFSDEYPDREVFEALTMTVQGTGGALTGSMLTTTTGIGVLVLAITPILGQFGVLTAISILYSYLTAMLVLPSGLVLWARFVG